MASNIDRMFASPCVGVTLAMASGGSERVGGGASGCFYILEAALVSLESAAISLHLNQTVTFVMAECSLPLVFALPLGAGQVFLRLGS